MSGLGKERFFVGTHLSRRSTVDYSNHMHAQEH